MREGRSAGRLMSWVSPSAPVCVPSRCVEEEKLEAWDREAEPQEGPTRGSLLHRKRALLSMVYHLIFAK
jgi:hypothetical protein